MTIKKSVLRTIRQFSLLGDYHGATVTVALSGGADSMALLNVLLSLKDELGITVEAAHFNHMIRGNEADRDEEFVKEQCKRLGVKLYCGQGDVPSNAKENGISLETAARNLRYDFLSRVNKDFVATAHTASDNLETVIFNLTRGTAIDGLCGIPPKRDIFIRPLIFCTREQIESYCEENNIPYVTDSTNLCDDYSRNKIRHNIIPVLKDINPSVEKAIVRMSVALRHDSKFLNSASENYLTANVNSEGELSLDGFDALEPAVSSRVVKMFVEGAAKRSFMESVHIEAVLGIIQGGGKISLPHKWTVYCDNRVLWVENKSNVEQQKNPYIVNTAEMDYNLLVSEQKVNNLLLKNSIDCDKIVGELVGRVRWQGDSIRLKNRGCTKTLNKLYNEYRIPVEERDLIPVLADDKGVIWIYGIGVAHRCAVTENTKRILKIDVQKN